MYVCHVEAIKRTYLLNYILTAVGAVPFLALYSKVLENFYAYLIIMQGNDYKCEIYVHYYKLFNVNSTLGYDMLINQSTEFTAE